MRLPLLAPILLALVGLLAAPSMSLAATWTTTADGLGDAPTIQAGIDSAAVGDTVLVAAGTYGEHIDFLGKDIVLTSESGPEFTIIDGNGAIGSVVQIMNGESRNAVLEGFTIIRGSGFPSEGSSTRNYGGGVFIAYSDPTVRRNIIERNTARLWGAGIYAFRPVVNGPLIEDNIIRLNRATWNGGGIGIEGGVIRGNTIENNEAVNGDGGGIWIWTNLPGLTVVEDNVILNNVAGDHGGGVHSALINLSGLGTARITGNLIARCSAEGEAATSTTAGGGLFLYGGTQEVRNNTIVFNDSPGHASALGGAVSIEKGSPLLERNIIANTLGGGGVYCDPGVTATLRDNLVWDNVGGHSLGDCAGWELTNGNLEADPAFCDPSSDVFLVARFSPALTHAAGYLGTYPDPGCEPVRVETLTWGRLKRMEQ